jgi:hypothetical protein
VVGVSDGDTITVLDGAKVQHKIRLRSGSAVRAPPEAGATAQAIAVWLVEEDSASARSTLATICDSVNFDRFIRASCPCHAARKLYLPTVYISGELRSRQARFACARASGTKSGLECVTEGCLGIRRGTLRESDLP